MIKLLWRLRFETLFCLVSIGLEVINFLWIVVETEISVLSRVILFYFPGYRKISRLLQSVIESLVFYLMIMKLDP